MSAGPSPAGSESGPSDPRKHALIRVAWAYVLAFAAASLCFVALEGLDTSLLVRLGLADLVATVVVFGASVRHDNSSVYDPYWSVIPIPLAGYSVWLGWDSGANHLRALVVLALVCAWGVRLTHNWARGWTGFDHEDWRYVGFRDLCGRFYWLVSFLGIHLFPTVLVFLGCLPIVAALTEAGRPLGWLDLVAAVVSTAAIALERQADDELRAFVQRRAETGAGSGQTLAEGVWAWSRHPNYLGELSFWWGMYLFGLAAVGPDPLWLISGAVAMTALFNLVSIPLIEARMAKRRSDWADVCARVPRLVPRPWRRIGRDAN